MMKTKKYIFTGFIAKGINGFVTKVVFSDALNHADVILDYTKKDKSDKINYRPVIYLQMFQKCTKNYSITNFMIILRTYKFRLFSILSYRQLGFRKGHNALHCAYLSY